MKNDCVIDKFISCFKDITFRVINKPIKKTKVSDNIIKASEKDLKRMLAKAKKELSKARKSHKHNKISSDELFDFEYRVTEIKEVIARLNDNTDI